MHSDCIKSLKTGFCEEHKSLKSDKIWTLTPLKIKTPQKLVQQSLSNFVDKD